MSLLSCPSRIPLPPFYQLCGRLRPAFLEGGYEAKGDRAEL
jgi:hypothetical protein